MNAIEVSDLTVAYREHPVLWDLDLTVPSGILMAVVGPNGAGKTTLIKAILGLVEPAAGQVLVQGKPYRRQRHLLAYVPQRGSVDWDFPTSVLDVVMMGRYGALGWIKRPGSRERELAMQALEKVGMTDLAGRQISQLSGGQQQRVFLARALVQEASVLLLDEPMTGVDRGTEEAITALMRELRDGGATILHATHDLEGAADVSDLLCFVNGRVVAHGPPDETFTPQTLHATFGGEVMIVDSGDHAHVHGGGHHHGGHAHPDAG